MAGAENPPRIRDIGLTGKLVSFADGLSDSANRAALAFRAAIEAERWEGIEETSTTLVSVFLRFDPLRLDHESLDARLAALPRGITTPEYRVDMREGEPERFVARLLEALPGAPGFAGARLETLDGVRAELADGWALIRASNTSPSLSLRLEADSPAALDRIIGDLRALLTRLDPNLRSPFEESGTS